MKRAIWITVAIFILLIVWYYNSITRIEYELGYELPIGTEILSRPFLPWIVFHREAAFERNLEYELRMDKDDFTKWMSQMHCYTYDDCQGCESCDDTLLVGDTRLFYPKYAADNLWMTVLRREKDIVVFTLNLDYNQ